MGLIDTLLNLLFGSGRNAVVETAHVFRENAESGAARNAAAKAQSLEQFAAEFGLPKRSRFDTIIDGLNRLPRPALAFGTLGLFISAMVNPIWFSERMQGLALVPEPLWWLLGAVVSFYFGARHQLKSQEFQRSLAATVAMTPGVVEGLRSLHDLRSDSPGAARAGTDAALAERSVSSEPNPALQDWRRDRRNSR